MIGSNGVLLDRKKILLLKRGGATNHYPFHWCCPGGHAEEGETPAQTAAREVKEESGLDFRPTGLFWRVERSGWDLYFFLGDWSGTVRPHPTEVTEFGWFSYDEALHLDLVPYYRVLVEKLHADGLL